MFNYQVNISISRKCFYNIYITKKKKKKKKEQPYLAIIFALKMTEKCFINKNITVNNIPFYTNLASIFSNSTYTFSSLKPMKLFKKNRKQVA